MLLPGLANYDEYFRILLNVSGVLLGLTFAALIFVMQSGFASFRFSRRMFLEFYVRFGRNLMVTLAYLVVMSLGSLFAFSHQRVLALTFYLFMLMFVKTLLDYYAHMGYIQTLFLNRFVPASYGPVRTYFRFLKNLGFWRLLPLLVNLALLVVWPVSLSLMWDGPWAIGQKSLFYSTLLLLLFAVLRITQFVPTYFSIANMQLDLQRESEDNATEQAESPVDFRAEKQALLEFLGSRDVPEAAPAAPPALFLQGTIKPQLLVDDKREAWFNVMVSTSSGDVKAIRDAILAYGYRFFGVLRKSMVDINSFVLSFHIELEGDSMFQRNIFFRTNRGELADISDSEADPISSMKRIENKLFDELFRDLG